MHSDGLIIEHFSFFMIIIFCSTWCIKFCFERKRLMEQKFGVFTSMLAQIWLTSCVIFKKFSNDSIHCSFFLCCIKTFLRVKCQFSEHKLTKYNSSQWNTSRTYHIICFAMTIIFFFRFSSLFYHINSTWVKVLLSAFTYIFLYHLEY